MDQKYLWCEALRDGGSTARVPRGMLRARVLSTIANAVGARAQRDCDTAERDGMNGKEKRTVL
jgi:hypothetical protein